MTALTPLLPPRPLCFSLPSKWSSGTHPALHLSPCLRCPPVFAPPLSPSSPHAFPLPMDKMREEEISHLAALRPICPLPISPPSPLPISPPPLLTSSLPQQRSALHYLPPPPPPPLFSAFSPLHPLHLPIRLPPAQVALAAAAQEARRPVARPHHTLHTPTSPTPFPALRRTAAWSWT
ncbi:unnamed protein product [Closterium sp. Naga37s-1]|nr:unnamed protein product [Closterium sp. Naga37s-1]